MGDSVAAALAVPYRRYGSRHATTLAHSWRHARDGDGRTPPASTITWRVAPCSDTGATPLRGVSKRGGIIGYQHLISVRMNNGEMTRRRHEGIGSRERGGGVKRDALSHRHARRRAAAAAGVTGVNQRAICRHLISQARGRLGVIIAGAKRIGSRVNASMRSNGDHSAAAIRSLKRGAITPAS